jgi:hypothetical protein
MCTNLRLADLTLEIRMADFITVPIRSILGQLNSTILEEHARAA